MVFGRGSFQFVAENHGMGGSGFPERRCSLAWATGPYTASVDQWGPQRDAPKGQRAKPKTMTLTETASAVVGHP